MRLTAERHAVRSVKLPQSAYADSSLGDGAVMVGCQLSVTDLIFDSVGDGAVIVCIAGRLRLTAERHAGRSLRVVGDKRMPPVCIINSIYFATFYEKITLLNVLIAIFSNILLTYVKKSFKIYFGG